jgi:hypothetical protein
VLKILLASEMDSGVNIYVVYDEVDNSVTTSRSKTRWIDDLCKHIEHTAYELNGMSPKIKSIDEFIPDSISDGAYIVLVVLSHQSRKSKKVSHHIESFLNAFKEEESPKDNSKGRFKILKILKSPIKYYDQPASIRDLDPYEFFSQDNYDQKTVFSGAGGDQTSNEYWIQVSALTHSIIDFADNESEKKDENAPTVYLANCSRDLFLYRNIIKGELLRDGYRVLPTRTYPDDPKTAKELITSDINKSMLSIHLIGMYAEENLCQSFSLSDIQYHAATSNKNPDFRKLIWTYPETNFVDEQQNSFYELIKRDSENKENSDILQSTLEELKTSIKAISRGKNSASVRSNDVVPMGMPIVYIIYDINDSMAGQKLSHLFKDKKYEVLTPVFDIDFVQARKKHNENMNKFDVAIILCEKCTEKWLQMKLMELMKSSGIGREKPVRLKLVIIKNDSIDLKLIKGFQVNALIIEDLQAINAITPDEIIHQANILQMIKTH